MSKMKRLIVSIVIVVLAAGLIGSGTVLYFTFDNLMNCRSELKASQNTVLIQNHELADRDAVIKNLQDQLDISKDDLANSKAYLAATQDNLNQLLSVKKTQEIQLQSYKDGLHNTKLQLNAAEIQVQLYQNTYGAISAGEIPLGRISDGNIKNLYRFFRLNRNPDALNPTWEQLLTFLENDHTDENPYVDGMYTCGNYAEDIFNHAESKGIRTAVVCISFKDNTMGHALNAFQTTDNGLVFIDCTGGPAGFSHPRMVSRVDLKMGQTYQRQLVFALSDYSFDEAGEVQSISFFW
jgi:hypothetical protein